MDSSNCAIHNPLVGNDPEFDSMLKYINIHPEQKLVVFLTICVVVRLLIAGVANVYHEAKYTPYITAIGALFAMTVIGQKLFDDNSNQWWDRKLHFTIATLVAIASGYQIVSGERDRTIAYLLYTDVFAGLATFAYVYLSC